MASLSGPREEIKEDGSVTAMIESDLTNAKSVDVDAKLAGISDLLNMVGGGKSLSNTPAQELGM